MKKLFLAAALPALAFAGAVNAGHHKDGDHANHGEAMFMQHHGEALMAALNHPTRAADKPRDQYRNPAETLAFFHVAPHMKVGEYSPGGGWYSRVLGIYISGEGKLVGVYPNANLATNDPERQQGVRDAAAAFPERAAGWTGAPVDRFGGLSLDEIPEAEVGTFDRILVVRSLHGRMRDGIADSEIRAMRTLLKDGGMLGIVQHRAKADAPFAYASGSRGYLREADVIAFMQVHGFELAGKSEVNANPNDTADHPQGVWEMPPVWTTKREELKDLGESDRMTLLFKKAD